MSGQQPSTNLTVTNDQSPTTGDDIQMDSINLSSPSSSTNNPPTPVAANADAILSDLSSQPAEPSNADDTTAAAVTTTTDTTTTNTTTETDPWDYSTIPPPPPTESDEAISHLRESSTKLTTALKTATIDLDSKIGLSNSVRNLDRDLQVSSAVSDVGRKLSGLWQSWDSQYQIGAKTREVTGTLSSSVSAGVGNINEKTVKPLAEKLALGEKVSELHLDEKLSKANQSIRKLDEDLKVTATTAETLAKGADFLAKSLTVNKEEQAASDYEKMVTEMTAVDEAERNGEGLAMTQEGKEEMGDGVERDADGMPTSFQKK